MKDAHRLIVVIEDQERNPYELWVLCALLISSTVILIGWGPNPTSLQASLPQLSRTIWNVVLTIGSSAALLGLFWKNPALGKTLQIFGHLWTASGAFLYACLIFYYVGLQALMAGLIVIGITAASVTKALQLRRQLKRLIKKVEAHNEAGLSDVSCGGD